MVRKEGRRAGVASSDKGNGQDRMQTDNLKKQLRWSFKHDHVTATSSTSRSLHNAINLQLVCYQEDSVASRRTKVAVGQP